MLVNRFIINLRSAACPAGEADSSFHASRMSTVNFHGSGSGRFLGNIGEPLTDGEDECEESELDGEDLVSERVV